MGWSSSHTVIRTQSALHSMCVNYWILFKADPLRATRAARAGCQGQSRIGTMTKVGRLVWARGGIG